MNYTGERIQWRERTVMNYTGDRIHAPLYPHPSTLNPSSPLMHPFPLTPFTPTPIPVTLTLSSYLRGS